jgi:hypothetical protein
MLPCSRTAILCCNAAKIVLLSFDVKSLMYSVVVPKGRAPIPSDFGPAFPDLTIVVDL